MDKDPNPKLQDPSSKFKVQSSIRRGGQSSKLERSGSFAGGKTKLPKTFTGKRDVHACHNPENRSRSFSNNQQQKTLKDNMLLYLDLCAFNRPFDNQKQTRIHIETEAKLVIQEKILMNEYQLVWSYMMDFENHANPFEERRNAIKLWKSKAIADITETNEILEIARFHVFQGISTKDALHLGCAQIAGCVFFITTDDKLIKKSSDYSNIKVVNPVTFIELNNL